MLSKEEYTSLALLIANEVARAVQQALTEIFVSPPVMPPPSIVPTMVTKLAVMREASVLANSDILGEGITVPDDGSVAVCACFDASGVLSFSRRRNGPLESFNEGNALTANSTYYFGVLVEKGEVLNFRYSVDAGMRSLYVYFIPSVV